MMGSQTALGIPYPVGTDLIADGDNAIQALAESVDLLLRPPRARIYLSTTATLASNWQLIPGWTTTFALNGITLGSGTRLTVPKDGVYRFAGVVMWASGQAAAGRRGAMLRLNAAGSPSGGTLMSQAIIPDYSTVQISVPILEDWPMTAGDYVEVYGYHDGAGTNQVSASTDTTHLGVSYVGPAT